MGLENPFGHLQKCLWDFIFKYSARIWQFFFFFKKKRFHLKFSDWLNHREQQNPFSMQPAGVGMFSSPASHTSLTRNSLETWDALSILFLGHYELNHVFLCGRCRRCLLIMWLYFNIGPWDLQGPCLRLNEKNTTVGAQTYKTRALTSRGWATVFCPVLWIRGHLRKQ